MYNFVVKRSLSCSAVCFGLLIACGASVTSTEAPPASKAAAGEPLVEMSAEPTDTSQEPSRSSPSPPEEPPLSEVAERQPQGEFPPPHPGPMFERSAQAGDGIWRDFFWFPEGAKKERVDGEVSSDFADQAVRRLVIHPHEASRFQVLTVAAFDLEALRLAHVAGRKDVEDLGRNDLVRQAGLVGKTSSLLAVFNGGFQPRHGRWGMLSLGVPLIPPREHACTVGVTETGRAVIGPWFNVSVGVPLVAYRQTPPCLVDGGDVHPALLKKKRGAWAGQHADRKTRRRSAVGLSEDTRTLFFAVGTETEPEILAAGMRHIGAHWAAQLDINWNWTRLFLFHTVKNDSGEAQTIPAGALLPQMAKDRGEYIVRPGKRGFFSLNFRHDPELSEEEAH